MSNWQTKIGRDVLRQELKSIEATMLNGNLIWSKINKQQEDTLAVTVDIIKRQIRKGLIELKDGFSKDDDLFKSKN